MSDSGLGRGRQGEGGGGTVETTANTQGSLTRVNYATFAAVDHLLIAATPTLSAALSAAARTTSAPSSVTRLQVAYEEARGRGREGDGGEAEEATSSCAFMFS